MTRYTGDHKEATRERILAAASKEFRAKGVSGATVPSIMETAGLTVGGFYKHFESKSALFAEMFRQTLRASGVRMNEIKKKVPRNEWLSAFAKTYLTPAHRANLRGGCVMAGLASDMPRAGEDAKLAFEEELLDNIDAIASGMPTNSDKENQEAAWAYQAMLLGGLIMARGVQTEETAGEILSACRNAAADLAGRG